MRPISVGCALLLSCSAGAVLHAQEAEVAAEAGPEVSAPPEYPTAAAARGYGPENVGALAQRAPVTTLHEAIGLAFARNPTLEAERANTRSARYRLPQAKALFGPSIDYNFGYGYRRTETRSPNRPDIVNSGWTRTVAATLNQPIFTFGRLSSNLRGARAEVEFQNKILEATEQQTLFDAVAAYVAVRRDREAVLLAEDNRANLVREIESGRSRFAVREITAPELEQVVTRFGLADADLAVAKATLEISEANFLAVIGAPAGDLEPLEPLVLPAGSLESAIDLASLNNPVLAAAVARERISRAAAQEAYADRLPRIDFQGQAARSPLSPYVEEPSQMDYQALFSISGNLFDSGLRANRQKELEALNDADVHLIDQARRDLVAETMSAWGLWQEQQSAILSADTAVEAAQKAYDGATLQQKAGFRTTLDVLILARELNQARISLNSLTTDTYLGKLRILLAMGALDPAMFEPSDTAPIDVEPAQQGDGATEEEVQE